MNNIDILNQEKTIKLYIGTGSFYYIIFFKEKLIYRNDGVIVNYDLFNDLIPDFEKTLINKTIYVNFNRYSEIKTKFNKYIIKYKIKNL